MLSQTVSNVLLNPGNTNIKPGLQRMQQVLARLNNPQNKYKVIHITGTNGKGSTAAFIAAGLTHAGFKTGKFMSPYIFRINECITLGEQIVSLNHEMDPSFHWDDTLGFSKKQLIFREISDADIERIYFLINDVVQCYSIEQPSPFELLTLIMFYYMYESQVEYLVLEAGMGGETDCTNVVDSLYSIITNVGLEHTQWLGDTLDKIATNKAGIIKKGKTIVADNGIELLNAVKAKTNNYINVLEKYQLHLELDSENFKTNVAIGVRESGFQIKSGMTAEKLMVIDEHSELKSNGFQISSGIAPRDSIKNIHAKSGIMIPESLMSKNYSLGLYGKFQAYNFLIAYEIFKDLNIPEESIVFAAQNTFIPYRFQIMERESLIIYDITHNLAGAVALVGSLKHLIKSEDDKPGKSEDDNHGYKDDNLHATDDKKGNSYYSKDDIVFVTAILRDKDIVKMLETFSQISNSIIFTSITNNPRAINPNELKVVAKKSFEHTYVIDGNKEALQFAKSLNKKVILVCGSSYIFKNLR